MIKHHAMSVNNALPPATEIVKDTCLGKQRETKFCRV